MDNLNLYTNNNNIVKQKPSDTRKPILTLKHLNKLRKIREIEKLEKIYYQSQLEQIYGDGDNNSDSNFM